MYFKTFVLIMLLGVCLCDPLFGKPRKFKKAYSEDKKFSSLQLKLEQLKLDEEQLEHELEQKLEDELDSRSGSVSDIIDFATLLAQQESEEEDGHEENGIDPCIDVLCGPGRECIISEEGEGVCQCVEECESLQDDRRKVCSNHNETWISDCELYRMRCFCSEGDGECRNAKFEHMHIDYYGVCQETQKCEENELADFPRRMREWLFNIMHNMADREELSDHYLRMERAAADFDDRHKWVNAAVWRWCELDGHPKDRSVSRHELFPLRAPLYTLEHCISPFLDSCDPDGDHKITLKEWSKCLELSDELSENIEDLCDNIRD